MPKTEITHIEHWDVVITPEEFDKWPEYTGTPSRYGSREETVRVSSIVFRLRAGKPEPTEVQLVGRRILRNGLPGEPERRIRFRPDDDDYLSSGHQVPGWADELIEHARQAKGLGRGRVEQAGSEYA